MEWIEINDGSRWPNPAGEDYDNLAWRFRYDQKNLDKIDFYNAAAVMETYSALITHPAFTLKKVQQKISGIRKEINK